MLMVRLWEKTQFIRTAMNKFIHRKFLKYRNSLVWTMSSEDIHDTDQILTINKSIAVQIHVYYPDVFEKMLRFLDYIPYRYDMYISTTDEKKRVEIEEILSLNKCRAENVLIDVYGNRGRDLMPFLVQMKKKIDSYDFVLHIHTKKSMYRKDDLGDRWLHHILNNILGNESIIRCIFCKFMDNPKLGLVYPIPFPPIWYAFSWDGDKKYADQIASRISVPLPDENEKIFFPAGNMFWARTDAINKIFDDVIPLDEYPVEPVPIDGTVIHAVERMWVYIAKERGYDFLEADSKNL